MELKLKLYDGGEVRFVGISVNRKNQLSAIQTAGTNLLGPQAKVLV